MHAFGLWDPRFFHFLRDEVPNTSHVSRNSSNEIPSCAESFDIAYDRSVLSFQRETVQMDEFSLLILFFVVDCSHDTVISMFPEVNANVYESVCNFLFEQRIF